MKCMLLVFYVLRCLVCEKLVFLCSRMFLKLVWWVSLIDLLRRWMVFLCEGWLLLWLRIYNGFCVFVSEMMSGW